MRKIYFILPIILTLFCKGYAEPRIHPTEIQSHINDLCQTHQLPGLQVSVKDTITGETWGFSSGYKDKSTLEPLRVNHLMQIGSVTKSVIASLALLLEADSENGSINKTFNIEQTVGDWLPQYPEWKMIKIINLLNMTSGIYNYTQDEMLFQEIFKTPHRIWRDHELVDLAYSHNPNTLFQAGAQYSYSNTNYILVGMILEKLTGQKLETLIDERILKKHPEFFKNTSYSPVTYPLIEMENMAHGYAMNDQKHYQFYQKDITSISLSYAGAAGAMTSTASDLANWVELIFSDRFLPVKQKEELKSLICAEKRCKGAHDLTNDSKCMGYGLGIMRVFDSDYGYTWTHTGETLGYHTLFLYIPEKSLIITVIINQSGPKIKGKEDTIFIGHQIFDLINHSN